MKVNECRLHSPDSILKLRKSLFPLNWKYFPFCETDLTRKFRLIGLLPYAFAMQDTVYLLPATSGIGAEQSSGHLYCTPLRSAA